MSFDSIVNRGDYFSAHYLAEVLPKDLKKKDGLLARWTEDEKAGRATPRRGLRAVSKPYFAGRAFFADFDLRVREGEPVGPDDVTEWRKELNELHGDVLRALGFEAQPRELTVERTGKEYVVQVAYADRRLVAVECGWAADVDAALDDDRAGQALAPVQLDNREWITSGTKLASWLFAAETPPRYVLILAGGVVVLADRATWGEGRYLAVSLDVALGRNNPAELEIIAALFGADSLLPPEEGGAEPLAELLTNSRNHAVGVSTELRKGLQHSVELIANEVLNRIRQAEIRGENGTTRKVRPEDVMDPGALAKELGREALRYLYRILFLLYAEARPELGILPTDDEDYGRGYSLARLGDLVVRDLSDEESRNGFHLYESLDLLFRMVNVGHRPRAGAEVETSEEEGICFEPLRSELFEPTSIALIGREALTVPGFDEDDPAAPRIDTRLRNGTLHKVLRLLMLTKGRRRERGGFISYAQLGINQLGAVYEGLMSYTGFIATEELYEVAKNGDDHGGIWTIPASKVDDYPSEVFVPELDDEGRPTGGYKHHPKGEFVYRLAGRDRETSASYYTPESLTQVTVQLALRHRLDQDGTVTPAREILEWRICEPALGSGAFLNEAINQVAAEYLRRRQRELGLSVDPEKYEEEMQRVKAYVALHNSYGVDLNETAIELAEVSVWLNVMHPGLRAPWFGLHLRRGNSLIGAGRRVYGAAELTKGAWLKSAPEDLPFSAGSLPSGKVHHFLLPAEGWGAVAGAKEAKELAPEQAKRLATWRKQIRGKVSEKRRQGQKLTQLQRLQALSGRAEYLWNLVVQRLTISEREISRKIDVWGADWIDQPAEAVSKEKVYGDLVAPDTPYWRLKKVMDAWCALWFWPLDSVDLLTGSDDVYARLAPPIVSPETVRPAVTDDSREVVHEILPAAEESFGFHVRKQETLFGLGDEQLDLDGMAQEIKETRSVRPKSAPKRPALTPLRPAIPLAGLDDWLDFAEALLGRVDIDHGDTDERKGLTTVFTTLEEMEHHEDDIVFWMGMESPGKIAERFPWIQVVDDIAEQQGFFHWELQFAQVFNGGGFDLQVGNPPWVRPRWEEAPVLSELEPWFLLTEKPATAEVRDRKEVVLSGRAERDYFLAELAFYTGMIELLGSAALYPVLGGTQPDLYRAFMCRAWANLSPHGVAGLIHPDTHFGGVKEGRFRAATYRHLRLHAGFVNELNLFEEVDHHVCFGLHVYGVARSIDFVNISHLYAPDTVVRSLDGGAEGALPGIKFAGKWDVRPHVSRIIRVFPGLLGVWRRLSGDQATPVEQTALLQLVTDREQDAIEALVGYEGRLSDAGPVVSDGYDEARARAAGLIEWRTGPSGSWSEVILQGPHIGVATPLRKEPNVPCRNNLDWSAWDLTRISSHAIPAANYRDVGKGKVFHTGQNTGDGRRHAHRYRLVWRRMISMTTERSLFAALIPPGPAHVHAMRSLALADNRSTALNAGFWAALPLDYLLRITGRSDLQKAEAYKMPAPDPEHPLASALLVRTLRLNCLTEAYGDLWSEIHSPDWVDEQWAVTWPGLNPLADSMTTAPAWSSATPLRTERERRAALVEVDALVALWLGMTADQLVAIYRSRYPVLSDYEAQTWFDASGRKIARNHNTFGYGQTKGHYEQLVAHLDPEINGPVPDGYTAPFYKADREAEYRQAHAVFSERLRRAQAVRNDEDGNDGEGGAA